MLFLKQRRQEKNRKNLSKLEGSIRRAASEVVITGDFNAKSPLWGDELHDWRRQLMEEMVASVDLAVANLRDKSTFIRENAILDLTLCT